jgi:hypothetical protein
VSAKAISGRKSGGTGRSSGDDGCLVKIQRITVAFVEKSVGPSRDEAGPHEDGGGHGEKEGRAQTKTTRCGNLISPSSCSPCLLIGVAAPDRWLCWGFLAILGQGAKDRPAWIRFLGRVGPGLTGFGSAVVSPPRFVSSFTELCLTLVLGLEYPLIIVVRAGCRF